VLWTTRAALASVSFVFVLVRVRVALVGGVQ